MCKTESEEPGFLSAFYPRGGGGGQNEIVWIIGDTSMYLCEKHVGEMTENPRTQSTVFSKGFYNGIIGEVVYM